MAMSIKEIINNAKLRHWVEWLSSKTCERLAMDGRHRVIACHPERGFHTLSLTEHYACRVVTKKHAMASYGM